MRVQQSAGSSSFSSQTTWRRMPVYLTVVGGALILLLFMISSSQSPPEEANKASSYMNTKAEGVVQDSVNGVDYYHCPAEREDPIDLVLLHGAAFTKEDWKTSGILEKLCHVPALTVTALNLNHRGNHKDLKNVLDGLRRSKVIQTNKPVALVTPSASGYSVVDWISTGSIDELVQYVGYWIPVASPSIKGADETSLKGLNGRLPILAIYGSKDSGGKAVSERLQSLSGAKAVEISGGHPCYLDSPEDFIKEVLNFLK
jgi:hypothetical protein